MFQKLLIANRGEIAIRIARAAADLGLPSVAVFAPDDAGALHTRAANTAVALQATPGTHTSPYLDAAQLIAVAQATGCDAVHPGYGFLSERADFAQACAHAGLHFVGPTPEQLTLFGDKASARAFAQTHGVPLMPGLSHATTVAEAEAFYAAEQQALGTDTPAIVIKALGGGGGRGMRVVQRAADVAAAHARCGSEALAAFGVGGVYVERFMPQARHIEVQILGDGTDAIALGERECSLQRRFQKLVELAPSPTLSDLRRAQLLARALRLARACDYQGLGTFEFLVNEALADHPVVFIEANARLQVEHTVTEAVLGLDLVQAQLRVAAGARLADLGLNPHLPPQPQGHAIQWRINAETLDANGNARPGSGVLQQFALPGGPGVRVDTHGEAGRAPSPHYDTLLAKLVVHAPGPFAQVLRRSQRALAECHIAGPATNLALLQAVAASDDFATQAVHNRWVEQHLPALLQAAEHFAPATANTVNATNLEAQNPYTDCRNSQKTFETEAVTPGQALICAPMPARLVALEVAVGDVVHAGQSVAVLEAMKMEHLVHASSAGRVLALRLAPGDQVAEGQPLVLLETLDATAAASGPQVSIDPDHIRPDLQRVLDRHAFTLDAKRPAAVAKRHAQGGRTARENVADLCALPATTPPPTRAEAADDQAGRAGRFIEYGALAIAAQSTRRSLADLVANTPADGMVTGIGTVNPGLFGPERSRCIVLAYDYTVLAGTQGWRNHHKKDRMLALAHQLRLPVVLFAEGGGGRPGDVDMPIVAGLNNHTFSQFAALSGQVPVVGIVHGRCFAGNAALLGCADVIIATEASNIGMGGPAMIEGGGLGVYPPEAIGPSTVQRRNGVIDLLVPDEAAAVAAARHYLSFFQGDLPHGGTHTHDAPDQRLLRQAVPENRLRAYDMRAVLRGLVDTNSLLELRADFGVGILTALARIDGRAVGLLANNPLHLGGAIDADAADKASRFMQLCDAHGLPLVSLVDTPGFMVGPDIEAQAQVRHVCRMFVVAAQLRVPFFAVVLRKGYGLGAQAMTAGGFDAPVFNVSWPTGEFGGMGLEGAVRLGFRKELEAAPEGEARDTLFRELVAKQYANGEAINMATSLEIDAVIDPADTRAWLIDGLQSTATQLQSLRSERRTGRGRFVDAW